MTGQQAITEICKMLASGNVGVRIFKNRREINFSGSEYIVVNHLSFPQESGLQYGYANINIHVKDADTGEPDSGRINQLAALVLPLFKETEDAEGNVYTVRLGVEFSLYDDSFFPDEDGTSYQNFKIKVLYYN